MLKECPYHRAIPFSINGKWRSRYFHGIKKWHDDQYEMIDAVLETQDRFVAEIEFHCLYAAGQPFAHATYQEGFDSEDE